MNKIVSSVPAVTFDDVLILPRFTSVSSRKDVDLSTDFLGLGLSLPIMAANMDTITEAKMARAMIGFGATACLHRFMSVEDNVDMLLKSSVGERLPVVSVGLGAQELGRALALIGAGAPAVCVDVANGASSEVVKQLKNIKSAAPNTPVIVGNFATGRSVADFEEAAGAYKPDAYKVGIGPGSACTTRIKTGVGLPQLSAIMDIANVTNRVIADGGCKTPGDVAKAFVAGARMVMLGGMLAGTYEAPGELKEVNGNKYMTYRGSASKSSYEKQGKTASWRAVEGEEFLIPFKGPVENVLQDIEGGLRSACTYVGTDSLSGLHENGQFVLVTSVGVKESGAHGKTI